MKQYVDGFKTTWKQIVKHRVLFVILIILQIVLVSTFVGITFVKFVPQIFSDVQGVVTPLQNANYNPDLIEAGQPLTKDFREIYSNYESMYQNMLLLVLWLVGLFLSLHAILWVGSLALVHSQPSLKKMVHNWAKFASMSIALLAPFFFVVYFVIKKAIFVWDIGPESFMTLLGFIGILFMLLYYILTTAFTVIPHSRWNNLTRNALRKLRKIHHTIPTLLGNLILLSVGLSFIYITTISELASNFIVISTFIVLLILTVIRIQWITMVHKL